ncbi:MAG: hypothetical protein GC149_02255 [Gammaproteobacteria bacterium]|nr:hypothetical protein [Gammaproteobacteria bacterium]
MTDTTSTKQVYFHVGLGKTGTTYLQYEFFPRLKGIHYIQRTRYQRAHEIISRTQYPRYLVSREFDQQLPQEVAKFSRHYPDARVIIVLRRHDGWIASQYRRFAKNGIHVDFEQFFDIDHDQGLWKQADLNFMAKLRVIESHFGHKPLVLFQEDLKQDPYGFFDSIAAYTGASYARDAISLDAVHTSYSDKQLKAVRKLSRYLFPVSEAHSRKTLRGWLQWRRIQLTSYAIMYPARLLPDAWFNNVELIPQTQLNKIRDHFADDWAQCRAYARRAC